MRRNLVAGGLVVTTVRAGCGGDDDSGGALVGTPAPATAVGVG